MRPSPAAALLVLLLLLRPAFSEPLPKLTYSFTPRDGHLHVELSLEHFAPQTSLVLPTTWGDAANLYRGITNLRALHGILSDPPPDDPGHRLVTTVRGRARITYDLIQDWQGSLRESVRHRPHLDAAHLEINTANALIFPKFDLAQQVDCTFHWRLPPTWTLATSFGTTPGKAPGRAIRQRFRGPWNEVANAMFAAGDFQLARHKIGKGELVVAIRGTFGFTAAEANDRILRLIRLERDFWRDSDFPYFLVTLAPFGSGQSGSGGGGFTNAFNLHSAPQGPFSTGLLSLLAHETFHTWNPLKLGRIRSPEQNTNWFTEGFTTYYQDLLLWQAGLIDGAQYLEAVNRLLRDYEFSPARNTPLQQIIERSGKDPTVSAIPYLRGAMIAMWVDSEIRRQSNGASSLDAPMRDLFEERSRHADLTKDRIWSAFRPYLDPSTLTLLRQHVDQGTTVPAPDSLRPSCAQRHQSEMHEFVLGMDRTALVETKRVVGLQPQSAAAEAGLREGDSVSGINIYWNDATKPVRITLKDSGRAIQYFPRGPARSVPQYRCP